MSYKRISPMPVVEGGTGRQALTIHTVLVGNATAGITQIANGTTGQVLAAVTGLDPAWQTLAATGAVTSVNAGNNISITGTATAPIVNVAGTTNHAVQIGNVTNSLTSVAVGATNTVLLGNSGADPSFGAVPNAALTNSTVTLNNGNNITVTGGTPLALGGTASFNLTGTTNHTLQIGNASGSLTSLGVATNGQIPIGSAAADPVLATIGAGTNISVTNGAGTISIAATGTASFVWSVITVNQTAVVNNGYICNKAGTLALLLPATAVVGDLIEITGINTATGWQITQNANQQVFFGTKSTTVGVTGTITSTGIRDSIRLVCVVAGASTNWNAISAVGNLTIV